jgi:hypothetical protein
MQLLLVADFLIGDNHSKKQIVSQLLGELGHWSLMQVANARNIMLHK